MSPDREDFELAQWFYDEQQAGRRSAERIATYEREVERYDGDGELSAVEVWTDEERAHL